MKENLTNLSKAIKQLETDKKQLQEWVNDLQSGMYINCVYCGHRYGPKENTPVSMAEVLKRHIEKCPKHPLFHANKENKRLMDILEEIQCTVFPVDNSRINNKETLEEVVRLLQKAFKGKKSNGQS